MCNAGVESTSTPTFEERDVIIELSYLRDIWPV